MGRALDERTREVTGLIAGIDKQFLTNVECRRVCRATKK